MRDGTRPDGWRGPRRGCGLSHNGHVVFGHRRRWVGTDGAPVIRRWSPAGGAVIASTSRAPASATDVVDDSTPPTGMPAAPPIFPRSRWHGHPDYHPEVNRPSTRWGRPEPPAPEPEPEPAPEPDPAAAEPDPPEPEPAA